jgi:hypothetical protein
VRTADERHQSASGNAQAPHNLHGIFVSDCAFP